MNYKYFSRMLVFAFVLSLTLPLALLAESTVKPTKVKEGANFCANLTAKLESQNKKLADQLSKFETKRGDQLKKVSDNRLTSDEKRLGVYAKVDANRDNRIANLEAKATTTEQKAAIATFKATLTSITETRRQAIDVAVKAYRASVDANLATRKTSIDTARATLKTAVDAVLAKAKADCASGVDAQTVRATANAGIKTARQQFTSTVNGLDKTKAVLKTATEVRKEAVKKAQTDFKTAYDQALATLKTALGK